MPAAMIAIPIVASLFASKKASDATNNAANTAANATTNAVQQQATLSQPYRDLGQSAIPTLKSLLGIGGGDPTATLRATPGYEFAKSEGLTATKNAASSSGLLLSGNTLEGLDKFSTGLADSTYQSAVGNLQSTAGLGQAAAAGQATNVGSAGANLANIAMNRGNTQAGIDVNTIAGITRSLGSYFDNKTLTNTLAGLGGNQPTTPAYNPDWGNP